MLIYIKKSGYSTYMSNINVDFQHLAITGGGFKGIFVIGALRYLDDIGYLKRFKSYSGTSIGAVICFLITIGFTINELESLFTKLEAKKFFDIKIDTFLTEYGLCATGPLSMLFQSCGIQKDIPKDCTFEKHYEMTGKFLQITGSNLNTTSLELFSYKTTPNMCVYKALEITIAYPFVFKPVSYNGFLYGDGGLSLNTPINISPEPKKTLVLSLSINKNKVCNNLMEYVKMLTSFIVMDNKTYEKYKNNYISLSFTKSLTFNLSLTDEEKNKMVENGYNKTFHFFNEKLSNYYHLKLIRKCFNSWLLLRKSS